MFSQFKRLIAPPTTYSKIADNNNRLLSIILWSALFIVAASDVIIYFLLHDPYQSVVVQTSILLVIIIALVLMYRGQARLAAGAFVGSTWLIILGTAIKYDGVHGFAFTAYILVILMAGLLLGTRAGLSFAVLSLATGFLLMSGERYGVVPLRLSNNPFIIAWVVNSIYFIFTAVLLSLYTGTLNRALNTAHQNEQHLAERNRDLQAAHHLLSVRAEELTQEIAERQRAEQQLQVSLKEKETLLQEIHHRVKNNLQIVASLLSLQSQFLAYPAALDALAESQTRVRSMAMIHEQLYRSGNLAQLDFADYVSTLSRQVLRSYRGKVGAVNLQISVDNVSLPLDTAIPCGLLITEILSNAVKHAFPDFRSGQICINFCRCDGDNFQLTITDDGAGFPAELAGCLMKNGLTGPCVQSLGLQLIDSLTHQLDGKIRFDSQPGATVFEITFPAGEEFYPAETTTPNMMQA